MKIGIIGSHYSDFWIKRCLDASLYSFVEYLDEGLLTWEHYNVELITGRCQLLLDSAHECDWILLPPCCEMLYHRGLLKTSMRVIPLFLHYCFNYTLPGSKVGKIACFATDSVLLILKNFRASCVKEYKPQHEQNSNKYFQSHFPLYSVDSKHRDALFEIKKKRLVNKLIKLNCRKLKDYAVDSFIITDWGYLYFLPILRKSLGAKVKHPTVAEISQLLSSLLA